MKIIFFTSSHKIGLTGQLTEQAIAFSQGNQGDFTFFSGEKEQFPGLFNRLKAAKVNSYIIKGLDDHLEFGRLVKEFSSYLLSLSPAYVTVHTNWQLAIVVASRIFTKKKFKILYIMHGYRHNYPIRSIAARLLIGTALLLFVDDVITPSSFLKRKFSILGDKSKIIFIGEDEALFSHAPPPDFGQTKRLIFPAEFRSGKNQDVLIHAIKGYIDHTGDEDIELYLPGKGELVEPCKRLAHSLGLERIVRFPGFIDRQEMLQLYLKCQFALVSSNVETFGHCIIEPFVLGRVVFTRHVGVADDVIRHGETGFFFENKKDLVDTLVRVLPDKELCGRVVVNALQLRHLFQWGSVCQQHFDLVYK